MLGYYFMQIFAIDRIEIEFYIGRLGYVMVVENRSLKL